MNLSTKNVANFISDFKLQQDDKTIYFNAVLEYHLPEEIKKINSEVHIITSDNLSTIYFLNPEIEKLGLEDMFDAKKENIHYQPAIFTN